MSSETRVRELELALENIIEQFDGDEVEVTCDSDLVTLAQVTEPLSEAIDIARDVLYLGSVEEEEL